MHGAVQEWSKEQIVALVSCFVWQERLDKGTRLREKLQSSFTELQQCARRIAKVESSLFPSSLTYYTRLNLLWVPEFCIKL